jgi:hypothetical protein
MTIIYAMDWTPYFGGWDMNGLLAACAAGATPLTALVVLRVGTFFGFRVARWLVGFFGSLGSK